MEIIQFKGLNIYANTKSFPKTENKHRQTRDFFCWSFFELQNAKGPKLDPGNKPPKGRRPLPLTLPEEHKEDAEAGRYRPPTS